MKRISSFLLASLFCLQLQAQTTVTFDCINLNQNYVETECSEQEGVRHIPYGVVAKLQLTIPTSGNVSYHLYNPSNTSQYEDGSFEYVIPGVFNSFKIRPSVGPCAGDIIGEFYYSSGSTYNFTITDGSGDYGVCTAN